MDAFECIATNLDVIAFGDFDSDGDVDQADFGRFQACLAGLDVPYATGCLAGDSNADGVVSSEDLSAFVNCMNGPDKPPGC